MKHLGVQLRTVRKRLGKTLSEVSANSARLAASREMPRYKISTSWLNRIENDTEREIGAYPLMALLEIYSITLEGLLAVDAGRDATDPYARLNSAHAFLPAKTPVETDVAIELPEHSRTQAIPLPTTLVRQMEAEIEDDFLAAIIGRENNYLWPLVPPGTLVLVDTRRRSLLVRTNSEAEIQRPMFLLDLKDGPICCWCEFLDKEDGRIIVLPHPASRLRAIELRLGQDASVLGQVVAVHIPVVVREDQG